MTAIKQILWDWNGTLLDDTDLCIRCINTLLERRHMPLVTRDYYRSIFTFPVIDYYKKLGFDFTRDPFELLSIEFVNEYNARSTTAPLFTGAKPVLASIQKQGIAQSVVSAMPQEKLVEQIKANGVYDYFDAIVGLDHIHATSKIATALDYVNRLSRHTTELLMIGDTYHDFEVAERIGCACILIDSGHQTIDPSKVKGATVVKNIGEVVGWIR
jgi:phosphoglycolate phosphatase